MDEGIDLKPLLRYTSHHKQLSDSPRGAHNSATIFSLIETAKANGLEPYRYLKYIFTKLPLAQSQDDYQKLIPQHLDRKEFDSF